MAADNKGLTDVSEMMARFNKLANEIKDEGMSLEKVGTAFMMASCNYSTYIAAGNEGYLEETGIDKLVAQYKQNLTYLQTMRKAKFNPDAKD